MTCKILDEQLDSLTASAARSGAGIAMTVADWQGSLGATREAAIAAFTRGYDDQAEKLTRAAALETLMAIDAPLYGEGV